MFRTILHAAREFILPTDEDPSVLSHGLTTLVVVPYRPANCPIRPPERSPVVLAAPLPVPGPTLITARPA